MSSSTTIDLVWVKRNANNLLIACEDNQLNISTDHQAMVTFISMKRDTVAASQRTHSLQRKWHKLDQPQSLFELKVLLPNISLVKTDTDIE